MGAAPCCANANSGMTVRESMSELEQRRSQADRGVQKTRSILAKLRSALGEASNTAYQEQLQEQKPSVQQAEQLALASPELQQQLPHVNHNEELVHQIDTQLAEINSLRLEVEQLKQQQGSDRGQPDQLTQLQLENEQLASQLRSVPIQDDSDTTKQLQVENESLCRQLEVLSVAMEEAVTHRLDLKQQQFQSRQMQELLKCMVVQRDASLMLRFVFSWKLHSTIAAHEQGTKLLQLQIGRFSENMLHDDVTKQQEDENSSQLSVENLSQRSRTQEVLHENEQLKQKLQECSAALAASELQCSMLQSKVSGDDSEVPKELPTTASDSEK